MIRLLLSTLLLAALLGCASTGGSGKEEPAAGAVQHAVTGGASDSGVPFISANYQVVARRSDVAAYPADKQNVWVPARADAAYKFVRVENYPKPKPLPAPVYTPAAAPIVPPVLRTQVRFDSGRSALDASATRAIDRLLSNAGNPAQVKFVLVDGYADSIGTNAFNLALSHKRAESVSQYLIRKAVPAKSITVRGHGEQDPIADNDSPAGRAANRRAEIRIEQK